MCSMYRNKAETVRKTASSKVQDGHFTSRFQVRSMLVKLIRLKNSKITVV